MVIEITRVKFLENLYLKLNFQPTFYWLVEVLYLLESEFSFLCSCRHLSFQNSRHLLSFARSKDMTVFGVFWSLNTLYRRQVAFSFTITLFLILSS